jgi:hypothetical protein
MPIFITMKFQEHLVIVKKISSYGILSNFVFWNLCIKSEYLFSSALYSEWKFKNVLLHLGSIAHY